MYDAQSRREFLKKVAATAAATPLAVGSSAALTQIHAHEDEGVSRRSPNEKLNIGVIGVAARGRANLDGVLSQNIVALCDVDEHNLAGAALLLPLAEKYRDYRKLLERTDLDAVVVSTPDHSHAIPVVRALNQGLDVYCEKPLAHSVWEIRQMREAAAKHKAITQMGTQIHAENNYRRVVEIVQAGIIGPVRRVHVWQNAPTKPGVRMAEAKPPAHVDYDLWIGPAPYRPFHESHFHFNWRYWWDFGGGVLADMGCHYIDLPYWALDLKYAEAVEAHGEKTYQGDNDVPDRLTADFHFPARGEQPPVHLTWYHGGRMPEGAEVYKRGSAVLFEGDGGRVLADYGTHEVFLPDGETFNRPMKTIPPSLGHHVEWIEACKTRQPTTCNFDYSGALAETVLLGNVSYRAGGKKLEWDAEKLEAKNCPEAAQFVRREYRKGWELS